MLENYDKNDKIVGRGPVPRHARSPQRHREGQALAIQARTKKNARGQAPAPRNLKRSRGTGPRATKPRTASLIVGRGPVPRQRSVSPTIAGDRPPRYGTQNGPSYRRARACPSPCCGLPENRGGQAHALRYSVVCDRLIANGRATLNTPLSYRRARACPSPCKSSESGFSGF